MNAIDTSMFDRPARYTDGTSRQTEGEGAQPMDIIFIEGFTGETVIGIDPEELHDPQPVQIDLWAGLPRSRACETDAIHDTIDYGKVHGALQALLKNHGVQLLEALAEAIAQMLLVDFGAHWVRIALVKPRKFANVKAVGVTIERRRAPPGGASRREGVALALLGAGMFPPEGGH
ncbi:dihydroneopterin aldolase [Paraburkholderia mimosarum]|uniref:dihydroneopterin aldolase n=1 Tax=Paraburkholderia mimosarum TaxID=312026 RepID=UPI0039C3097C